MIVHQAASVVACQNALGEACIWNETEQSVWWTDIEARQVWRLDGAGEVTRLTLPDRPAFVFPRAKGGFVVGFPGGIATTDQSFREFRWVADIEPGLAETRVNDAAIDPWGGIVLGTYNQSDRRPIGGVYRISPAGEIVRLLDGVAAGNGLAFSPNGETMYFADTAEGSIRRFRLGPRFTAMAEIAPLAAADIAPGAPDGAAVDTEGGYWSTRLRGGCVIRIAPDGTVTDRVDLPSMAPTCATFGGHDLATLFITSRRIRQSAAELERWPQSGDLFSVRVPFAGTPRCACEL